MEETSKPKVTIEANITVLFVTLNSDILTSKILNSPIPKIIFDEYFYTAVTVKGMPYRIYNLNDYSYDETGESGNFSDESDVVKFDIFRLTIMNVF